MMSTFRICSSLTVSTVTCLLFIQMFAEASAVSCTPPQLPTLGYLETENGTRLSDRDLQGLQVGTFLVVRCLDGGRATGRNKIQCRSRDGGPSFGKPGSCRRAPSTSTTTRCSPPKVPEHGYFETKRGLRLSDSDLDALPIGTVLVRKCDDGYRAAGRNRTRCRRLGGVPTFARPGPCRPAQPMPTTITCISPQVPEHGYLETVSGQRLSDGDLQALPVGTVLVAKCDNGNRTSGSNEIRCASRNGVPTFEAPGICMPAPTTPKAETCTEPQVPEHGYLETKSGVRLSGLDLQTLPMRTVLLVKCDDGERPAGRHDIDCRRRDGVLTFEKPGICDPVVCTEPQLEHGYLETGSGIRLSSGDLEVQEVGTVLVAKCDDGGNVTGRNKIECQFRDGVGTFEKPGTCSPPPEVLPPNICTPPYVPPRGYLATEDGTVRLCDQALQALPVGTVLRAKCDNGGGATGRNKINCKSRDGHHPDFDKAGYCRYPKTAPVTPPTDCSPVYPFATVPTPPASGAASGAASDAASDAVSDAGNDAGCPGGVCSLLMSAGVQPTSDSIIITATLLPLIWWRM